jgi:hypothetical protein
VRVQYLTLTAVQLFSEAALPETLTDVLNGLRSATECLGDPMVGPVRAVPSALNKIWARRTLWLVPFNFLVAAANSNRS